MYGTCLGVLLSHTIYDCAATEHHAQLIVRLPPRPCSHCAHAVRAQVHTQSFYRLYTSFPGHLATLVADNPTPTQRRKHVRVLSPIA